MKHTQKISFNDITIDNHCIDSLNARTGKTVKDVRAQASYFKCFYGGQCKYQVLVNKQRSYPNQIFFYHERDNIAFAVDKFTKVAVTVLYLDGKDGYNNLYMNR